MAMNKIKRLFHDALRKINKAEYLGIAHQLDALQEQLATVASRQASPSARPYYYLGGNRALTQLSNGLPFFVNTNDKGIASWIILIGQWETFVDTVLTRLCDPGMRVLDLGANLGYYTVKLANLVGESGHVLSLEPNPELFPFVQDSITINGFDGRVRLETLAAAAEDGVRDLYFSEVNMGGGTLFGASHHPGARHTEVRTATLDTLNDGQPGFDLIKIDVEGWEPEVLRGMPQTLERSQHASIVTEVSWGHWSRFGDPGEILLKLLGPRDGLFIIHHDGGLERVGKDDLQSFQTSMRYALLTHWTEETARRLGDLVRT